jgi:tRNA U34 5-carboxymethylaminomethyl modifying GTPase MnmE/TrmE
LGRGADVEHDVVRLQQIVSLRQLGLALDDIRRCLHYLGEITGEITNEDQLDYIFSKFCIGK